MKNKLCVHGKYDLSSATYLMSQSSFCFMVASAFSWSFQASFSTLISLFWYNFNYFHEHYQTSFRGQVSFSIQEVK
jgi:hypothetical protein